MQRIDLPHSCADTPPTREITLHGSLFASSQNDADRPRVIVRMWVAYLAAGEMAFCDF